MTDRMEPTMQLRWRQPRVDEVVGLSNVHGRMPKVLQQLWQETTTWWDDDMKQRHSDVVAKEWRDVPVEEE